MKNIFSAIIILLVIAVKAIAQPMSSPTIRTIEVVNSSTVTLCWTVPSQNGNVFNEYQVFYADNLAGPFTMVGTVTAWATNTITINPLPVITGIRYFYVRTRFNVNQFSTPISDIIQSMVISVSQSPITTIESMDISWNPIHVPAFGTTNTSYNLFRKIGIAGAFVQVNGTTLSVTNYTDVINFPTCKDSIYYRVEIGDLMGCNSVSNVGVAWFDNANPDTPELLSVTVAGVPPNEYTTLVWASSTAIDVDGYYIYRENSFGSPIPVDISSGVGSTTIDMDGTTSTNSSAPGVASETYRIASFDFCTNTSNSGLPQKTIYLEAKLDACNGVTKLNWNKYINWPAGVDKYELYVNSGTGFSLLATLTANDTSYVHFPLIQSVIYTYYIKAIDGSGFRFSKSNASTITADVPIRPSFLYLKYATVVDNRTINIMFKHDSLADISKYIIMRSDNLGDTFDAIKEISFNALTSYMSYTDTANCLTFKKSYVYKILAIDKCDQPSYFSDNIARTIFLQANPELNMKNIVTWTDYEVWNGGVRSYKVFRGFQSVFSDIPAATIPFGENLYEDDIANRISKDGEYCYYVQAYQGLDTVFFFADSSRSNKVCIKQEKTFYLPNAFQPDGINKTFKPYDTFLNTNNYVFRIFNKWGERIFETTEPTTGWDGSINGKEGRMDVYIYYITFQDEQFLTKEYRGTVTLIR